MSQVTRHERICMMLGERGECSVEELATALGVSGMTVRRDLQALAEAGKLIRTHGGAAMAGRISFEFEFLRRMRSHEVAKAAIAAAAGSLIEDGQSVLLDSGTTTLALARRLHGKQNLTVITTSLPVASQLQYNQQIAVLLLGGYVRGGSPDLAGALTEANLETVHADMAFIGADAIDDCGAVYNQSPEVARMLTIMAASASLVYVVADHSKLGKTALWRFGSLKDWTGLVTDAGADCALTARLIRAGIHVIRARDK